VLLPVVGDEWYDVVSVEGHEHSTAREREDGSLQLTVLAGPAFRSYSPVRTREFIAASSQGISVVVIA
jgi:hypothetical protein